MMQAEHNSNIVRTIFKKENIRDVSVDELLIASARYPYSSLLQLFYSKTLKERNDPRYPSSVARTALYFSNPHWLHHQLQDKVDVFASLTEEPGKYIHEKEVPLISEENETAVPKEEYLPAEELMNEPVDQVAAEETTATRPEQVVGIAPAVGDSDLKEESVPSEEFSRGTIEAEVNDVPEEATVTETNSGAGMEEIEETMDVLETGIATGTSEIPAVDEQQTIENTIAEDADSAFTEPDTEEVSTDKEMFVRSQPENVFVSNAAVETSHEEEINIYPEFEEHAHLPSNPAEEDLLIDAELMEAEPVLFLEEKQSIRDFEEQTAEALEEYEKPGEDGAADIPSEMELNEIPEPDTADIREETETEEIGEAEENITVITAISEPPVLSEASTDVPEQIIPFTDSEKVNEQPDQPVLNFEPYHTIDYFASQGIRLTLDEDNKDQLTNKLRSFTEWLRSMKKIHPEKLKNELDEKTEMTIKSVAEHSNDQGEILTETMAEILQKQGLIDKALEVYEKLSLLNPSKSDYFAAKISELKAIGI